MDQIRADAIKRGMKGADDAVRNQLSNLRGKTKDIKKMYQDIVAAMERFVLTQEEVVKLSTVAPETLNSHETVERSNIAWDRAIARQNLASAELRELIANARGSWDDWFGASGDLADSLRAANAKLKVIMEEHDDKEG